MTPEEETEHMLEPLKSLKRAGVPLLHVIDQAERHLRGLKALPDQTELKQEAIATTEAFIKDLNEENDKLNKE